MTDRCQKVATAQRPVDVAVAEHTGWCETGRFTGYNHALTTKRAGTNRPFFLVECFWSSKLSGEGLRGLSGFLFFRD